jgi:hypothetical protein
MQYRRQFKNLLKLAANEFSNPCQYSTLYPVLKYTVQLEGVLYGMGWKGWKVLDTN